MLKAPKRSRRALRLMAGVGVAVTPTGLALGTGLGSGPAGAQTEAGPALNLDHSSMCPVNSSQCSVSASSIELDYQAQPKGGGGPTWSAVQPDNTFIEPVEVLYSDDGGATSSIVATGDNVAAYSSSQAWVPGAIYCAAFPGDTSDMACLIGANAAGAAPGKSATGKSA
jgi:hypothetical protein